MKQMTNMKEKETVDLSTIYQVASERFNVIHQQAQTAINISLFSVTAFGAAIGALFASMANGRDIYRLYADWFVLLLSVVAAAISFGCKRILDQSIRTAMEYGQKLRDFEKKNKMVFMPHEEFFDEWGKMFKKYEPFKMTGRLLIAFIIIFVIFAVAAIINIIYIQTQLIESANEVSNYIFGIYL